MNKARKAEIKSILHNMHIILDATQQTLDDERDAMDAMEEHWSETDRYQVSEDAVDALEDATQNMQEAIDALERIG